MHPQARFHQKAQGPPGSIQTRVSIGSRCQLVYRGLVGVGGMPGNPPRCSLTLSHMWTRADAGISAPTGSFSPKGSRTPGSIQGRVSIGSRCQLVYRGLVGVGGMPRNPPRCSLTLSQMWTQADAGISAPTGPF